MSEQANSEGLPAVPGGAEPIDHRRDSSTIFNGPTGNDQASNGAMYRNFDDGDNGSQNFDEMGTSGELIVAQVSSAGAIESREDGCGTDTISLEDQMANLDNFLETHEAEKSPSIMRHYTNQIAVETDDCVEGDKKN